MKYNTMMSNKIIKIFLIFLGALMFILYIYMRFIRERLPRDIPFNLTFIKLILLINICFVFIFILYSLIKTKSKNMHAFRQIIDYIFLPLKTLDQSIKNVSYIKKHYKCFIISGAYKINFLISESNIYIYLFVLLPRILLVSVLWFDVFYFSQLIYIYKFLFISLLFLINRYIMYSIKYAIEHFTNTLELSIEDGKINIPFIEELYLQLKEEHKKDIDYNDEEWEEYLPRISVSLKNFVDYQLKIYPQEIQDYFIIMNDVAIQNFCLKNNIKIDKNNFDEITSKYFKEINTKLKNKLKNILQLMRIKGFYDFKNNFDSDIKKIKILIYVNYLICWLYILIISLPSLDIFELFQILTKTWVEFAEPFSNIKI
jgi:hypothetical protein